MIILGIMLVGILIGTWVFPEKWHVYNNKVQVISIVVLIFCMGVSLGSNPGFMDQLAEMGIKGLVFAVIPIMFSIIMVYLLTQWLMKGKKDD